MTITIVLIDRIPIDPPRYYVSHGDNKVVCVDDVDKATTFATHDDAECVAYSLSLAGLGP
jgi:hypothetical protein